MPTTSRRADFDWSCEADIRAFLDSDRTTIPVGVQCCAEIMLATLPHHPESIGPALRGLLLPYLDEPTIPAPPSEGGYLVGWVGVVPGRHGKISIDNETIASCYPCPSCGGKLYLDNPNRRLCLRCGRLWRSLIQCRGDGWTMFLLSPHNWSYTDAPDVSDAAYAAYIRATLDAKAIPEARERWEACQ